MKYLVWAFTALFLSSSAVCHADIERNPDHDLRRLREVYVFPGETTPKGMPIGQVAPIQQVQQIAQQDNCTSLLIYEVDFFLGCYIKENGVEALVLSSEITEEECRNFCGILKKN